MKFFKKIKSFILIDVLLFVVVISMLVYAFINLTTAKDFVVADTVFEYFLIGLGITSILFLGYSIYGFIQKKYIKATLAFIYIPLNFILFGIYG